MPGNSRLRTTRIEAVGPEGDLRLKRRWSVLTRGPAGMQWIGFAVSCQIAFARFSASLTSDCSGVPKQPDVGSRSVPYGDPIANLGGDLSRTGISCPPTMFSRESTYT